MGSRDSHAALLPRETLNVKKPRGATSLGPKRTETVLLASATSPLRQVCRRRNHYAQRSTRSRSQEGHEQESALVFRSQTDDSVDPPAATHCRRHLPGEAPGGPMEKNRQHSPHLWGQTVVWGGNPRRSCLVPVPPHRAPPAPTVPLRQGKSPVGEVQEKTSVRMMPWYRDHLVLTQIRAKTSRRSPGRLSLSTMPIVPEPANQEARPAKVPIDPETRVFLVAQQWLIP